MSEVIFKALHMHSASRHKLNKAAYFNEIMRYCIGNRFGREMLAYAITEHRYIKLSSLRVPLFDYTRAKITRTLV